MRRLLGILAVAVTLAGLVGVSQASAPGLWSSPAVLAPNTGPNLPAHAVQSVSGQTIAAWADGRGVSVAIAGADRRFGRAVALTHQAITNDEAQLLAVDERGDALLMWEPDMCDTAQACAMSGPLFVSYRPARGSFGPVHLIASEARQAFAGLDARGNATMAWTQLGTHGRTAVDVVERRPDGRYAAKQTIASGTVGLSGLAVNDSGQAVIAWDAGNLPFTELFAASRRSGGRFGTAVQLASGGVEPTVGIDGGGVATIAWEGPYDGASEGTPFKHVEVSRLAVGATARGPVEALRTPGLGQLGDLGPRLYETPKGDALVVWQNLTRNGDTEKVVVARRAAGQQFTAAEAIGNSYPGGSVAAGVGPSGQAIVAWDSDTAPVKAVIADSPHSRFGNTHNVAPPQQNSAVPAVTIDATGRATAAWWDLGSHELLSAITGH